MAEGANVRELDLLRVQDDDSFDEDENDDEQSAVKPTREEQKKKWSLILEPALIGAMMAINIGQTSVQNFYLKTACTVDLGKPYEICYKGVGEEFQLVEAESQMLVSKLNISRSFVGALLATFVLLFAGPWSDCSGRRKPLLILALSGMCLMSTGLLLLLTFPGASTIIVLYTVQIPLSIGGNFPLLLAASFSHIGDVCHKRGLDVTRTFGKHRAAIQIAHVLGSVSGPLLYRNFGFYGVFPIVLFLQMFSLIYVIVYVKDVRVNTENKVSIANWRLPVNAMKCLVRRRQGNRRAIIVLILVAALGDRALLSAEVILSYMFFRFKYKWDDVLFGSYLAYKNIISFLGTIIILSVLKRRLKLSDEVVGVLSCISFMLASSSLIAAPTTMFVFCVPLIGIISQGSQVVQRPILTKQILPTEQGKIYSILGAMESATQCMTTPLYSLLYTKTVSTMADAWLIPGIVIASIQVIIYIFSKRLGMRTVYQDRRRSSQMPKAINRDILLKKPTHADVKNDIDNLRDPSVIEKIKT